MANTASLIGGASTYTNSFQPVSFTPASTRNGGNYSGVVGAAAGFVNGILDRRQERKLAEEQREWNEQMADKQNAWSLDMWNKTNEYNSPSEQVKRLREAGLNPLYYGLDGTSANAFQSAQVQGYDRASMAGLSNPFGAGLEGYMSMKSLAKDIELKNAQIDKTKADTASVGLDNEWKDKTMEARVESQNLANSLTKETIDKVRKEKSQIEENIKKTIEETKNEVLKGALIDMQTRVAKAQEKEIIEMLPYKKLLTEAQTEAQKASASLAFLNAMQQRKLIEGGYIENLLNKSFSEAQAAGSQAVRAEAEAVKAQCLTAVRTGNAFAVSDDEFFAQKYGKMALNSLLQDIMIVADAALAPVAGIFK